MTVGQFAQGLVLRAKNEVEDKFNDSVTSPRFTGSIWRV